MADKKTGSIDIEAAWIRELAAIMTETSLTEIEIEKADVRLRVSRGVASVGVAAPAVAPPPAAAATTPQPMTETASEPARSPAGAVPSPMVGTVYLSPSPGADPFVRKGDTVSEGQTLMIVEAMKTMNPIASPRGGVVKDILVQDAQPVEFGEALVVLE